jgi:cyanophycinase
MAGSKTECPVPQGTLLIIGGRENKGEKEPDEKEKPQKFSPLEILQTFIDLLTNKEPVIEVITTASGLPDETYKEYKKLFQQLGIQQVGHIHHRNRKEVLEDDLTERIRNAHGFYFTGGDQLRLTSFYGGTKFLTLLKEKYIARRIVIAGTSAGAMALSTPMIYGGSKEKEQIGGEIQITTGMEFLKDVCIDTHFVFRGRFIRMAQVIVTNPTCIGIGLDEDTAIIVRNGNEAEVIGSGLVIVIDGFHIHDSNIEDFGNHEPVTIKNLKMHILGAGEKYLIPQVNPPHR